MFPVFLTAQLLHLVQFQVCFWRTLFRRSQSPQVPAHRTLPLLRQTIRQPRQASRHQRLLPALHWRKRSRPAVGWGFFRAIKRRKKNPEQTSKQVRKRSSRGSEVQIPTRAERYFESYGPCLPPSELMYKMSTLHEQLSVGRSDGEQCLK